MGFAAVGIVAGNGSCCIVSVVANPAAVDGVAVLGLVPGEVVDVAEAVLVELGVVVPV